jgi:flagellar motor switch/type III secretory pathway protein FliN
VAQPDSAAVLELSEKPLGPALLVDPWDGLLHVPTMVSAEVEVVGLTVRELFRLEKGSIVSTAQVSGANIPLYVGGRLVAWGEFQVVGDLLAVRVAELA